jgi:hypothetical protein
MANKPLHPTPKSIRTGQTIYQVGTTYDGGTFINSVTIGSKRTPPPGVGAVITVVSPQFLRGLVALMEPWLVGYTFYSWRRAETFRARLQRVLDANPRRQVYYAVETQVLPRCCGVDPEPIMAFNTWLEKNEDDLDTLWAELGADRELCFDKDRRLEESYADYVEAITTANELLAGGGE